MSSDPLRDVGVKEAFASVMNAVTSGVGVLAEHYFVPNFLLTASQAIQIGPGETPQPFHADDLFYTIPRPRPMVSLSTDLRPSVEPV